MAAGPPRSGLSQLLRSLAASIAACCRSWPAELNADDGNLTTVTVPAG